MQPVLPARESGLPKDSRALCDQVRTIDKERIRRLTGALSGDIMRRIDRGLVLHLKLEDYLRNESPG